MKAVFTGGSRSVSRLNSDIRARLDNIIEKELQVYVGDANGADKAIQSYLHERNYRHVLVFCMEGECRNNVGSWPLRAISPPHQKHDFGYFMAKDAAMAKESECGLMLWDGKSAGTMLNAARLIAEAKPVVLYVSPRKSFETLRTRSEFATLLAQTIPEARRRIHGYLTEYILEFAEPSFFDSAA